MDQTTELLSAWIDSARDYAIILVDVDGHVSSWNIGAERILGYAESEVVGQPIEIFFTPEDRQRGVPEREIAEARLRGRASDDRWHIRKGGSRFWCSGVLMRVGDGPESTSGFVKVMRDLTERKLMEDRLRARTEELMAADHRRNEFLAMLSHELRNPLSPIMASAHVLRDRLPKDDATVQEAREIIERQTLHLKQIVDGLLDVSRMALKRIELHKVPMDWSAVVERAVESVRPMVDERRHELTTHRHSDPILMSADPVRLEQAVAALLSNAARFTDPGGHISVTVAHEGENAIVRVRDNGIGMEPELRERAFDLFAQGDQGLARTAGGLGIGLTLACTLARLHGGTVVARSEGRGHGSEFTLSIPVVPVDAVGEPASHADGTLASLAVDDGHSPAPARILLVDDNRDAARGTELVLRQAGHDVRIAHDGPTAIEMALQHRPDLVILDVGLPQIDGYGVARALRRQTTIPLVALSGYAPEDRSSTLFDAYLVKPVQPDELVRVLESVR